MRQLVLGVRACLWFFVSWCGARLGYQSGTGSCQAGCCEQAKGVNRAHSQSCFAFLPKSSVCLRDDYCKEAGWHLGVSSEK